MNNKIQKTIQLFLTFIKIGAFTFGVRIVEGVYSQHPKWRDLCDLTIFLTADRSIRLKRIEMRNGAFLLKRFQDDWIPKEDLYFDTFSIPFRADLTVETGAFF